MNIGWCYLQTLCWLLLLILFLSNQQWISTLFTNFCKALVQKAFSFMTNIILIQSIQKKYHTHPMSLNTSTKAECLVFVWWNGLMNKTRFPALIRTPVILVLRHTCKSPLENNKQYNDYITLLFNLKFIFSIYLVRWPIIYLQQNCF